MIRSSRSINDDRASVLQTMTSAGIRPVDAFEFLVGEAGGIENLGFTKRDAYNYIQKEKRIRIDKGDTTTLMQLFGERQTDDNMFRWNVQFDENDRLVNFFWVDGVGRIDYDCYGDVIVFDTSYRLNKYNLACAPIVGVNNHWQNVLLGVAFLSDETTESFSWLFKTFKEVMGGKHPTTIFTDQDQAMAKAIEDILPNTCHRLCQWHISKKAPSKVPCFNSNSKVRNYFYKCLSKCDSEEEFEEAWSQMIAEGDLQNHTWLKDLYRIKHKWSTAFTKNVFSIGMLSTQRSETTNNVCHGISKATSSITDCFLGMESMMKTWRRNEREEDYKCSQTEIVPILKSNPMLKQAAKFYTKKLYSFFEYEFLQGVSDMIIQPLSASEFKIKSVDLKEQSKTWFVNYEAAEGIVECSCKKFQTMGLLCRHSIKVLNHHSVFTIPTQYLLPRWSTTAKKDYYQEKRNCLHNRDMSSKKGTEVIFRNHICRMAYEMSTRAQGNHEAEDFMRNTMKQLSDDIDLVLCGKPPKNENMGASKRQKKETTTVKFKDPAKVRPKGISNSRLKGYWEKGKRRKYKAKEIVDQILVEPTPTSQIINPVEPNVETAVAPEPSIKTTETIAGPATEATEERQFNCMPKIFMVEHYMKKSRENSTGKKVPTFLLFDNSV